jgi:hypothetical protein
MDPVGKGAAARIAIEFQCHGCTLNFIFFVYVISIIPKYKKISATEIFQRNQAFHNFFENIFFSPENVKLQNTPSFSRYHPAVSVSVWPLAIMDDVDIKPVSDIDG